MTQNIILTGFMGTGKSTVGRRLAKVLSRRFIDMDSLIEEREGRPITQIFEEAGEPYFRQLEADLCKELAAREGLVISTGGGTLVSADNLGIMAQTGLVICLDCDIEEIWRRISESENRPMLGSTAAQKAARYEQMATLYETRGPAYARIKHHIDVTTRSPREVVEKIRPLLEDEDREQEA